MVASNSSPQAQNGQSEDPFHLLVEGVKDYAIYMLDEGGHVATWNAGAERIKGYKSHEIIGRHYSAFFTPEDREAGTPEQLLAIAKDRGRTENVGTRVRKDGSHFTADVVITALYGPNGVLRGYGKVTRDITDRIRHEEEKEEASRRKDEFLAVLAHELRNPLAPIMSHLILLTEDPTVRAGAQEHVKAIQRQARHLIRLMDDLLDVARIESGTITIHREKFALQDVLALAVEMTRPFIATNEQHLHVDIPNEQIVIEGDFARLAQIVSNLLNNAAKFNDTDGKIWLTARREGDGAVVTVKDNGIGIPAEAIPHLFENFYRVEHPPNRTRDGMGVGLSLAYQLVRLHGGSMQARSEGLGLGSELIVSLPACPDEESPTLIPDTRAPQIPKQRLLVVDDNTDAGAALAAVLQVSGHEVIAVASGNAALSALEIFRPDAIIIDIGMPDMNGFELAERIRRLPLFHNKVRLIAVSGYGQEQDRERSKTAGFDAHFLKPVEMGDLLSAIGVHRPACE